MNECARLTQPYTVYLAAHDIDLTLPTGTRFEVLAKLRGNYFGMHQHAMFGEVVIDTPNAEMVDE